MMRACLYAAGALGAAVVLLAFLIVLGASRLNHTNPDGDQP